MLELGRDHHQSYDEQRRTAVLVPNLAVEEEGTWPNLGARGLTAGHAGVVERRRGECLAGGGQG
jgi:hypothetical protein